MLDIDWAMTLGAALAGAVLLAVAVWREAQPKRDIGRPSWVSWRFVMLLAGTILMFVLVHTANKLGVRTGGNAGLS